MSLTYLEYDFKVNPAQPGIEILIAQLGQLGFESFVEYGTGVKAYIQENDFKTELLTEVQILQSSEFDIAYSQKSIEQVNWNAEWEKNFKPILVDDRCAVRAPFHTSFELPYEIVIEPKMSFGTGHHETTFMMLQWVLDEDLRDKRVLDMGCGTAVLAILASMKGAKRVDAIDIDPWCVENSEENIVRNQCKVVHVLLGDASVIPSEEKYNVILANINRNILLNDLPIYSEVLAKGGLLFLSGFYTEDLEIIKSKARECGLKFVSHRDRNDWISAKFVN